MAGFQWTTTTPDHRFGADGNDARAVADALALEAFHNVSFIMAPFE